MSHGKTKRYPDSTIIRRGSFGTIHAIASMKCVQVDRRTGRAPFMPPGKSHTKRYTARLKTSRSSFRFRRDKNSIYSSVMKRARPVDVHIDAVRFRPDCLTPPDPFGNEFQSRFIRRPLPPARPGGLETEQRRGCQLSRIDRVMAPSPSATVGCAHTRTRHRRPRRRHRCDSG